MKTDPHDGWKTPPDLWGKLKPLAREKRHAPTEAEITLWQYLRGRQVCGVKFRRQHTVGPFIVDFFGPDARLVIEVDGGIHQYTVEEDAIRQAYLEARGLIVLRVDNDEIAEDISAVIQRIEAGLTT